MKITVQATQAKEEIQKILEVRIMRIILKKKDKADQFLNINNIKDLLTCMKKGRKCSK